MARIRSVHPSIFTNEAWVSCSPLARLLYIGLWTDADDQGLFEWKPLQIKMRLLPGDGADVSDLLAELVAANLIAQIGGGTSLGAIRNFRKFQRPKKPNAVHVLPDEWREYVAIDSDEDDPTQTLRRQLCEGQDSRCFYCATEITFYSKRFNSCDIDHRIPTSKGGTDAEENLVAACRACNRGKNDRSEAEWRAILMRRATVAVASGELAPQMEDGGEDGGGNSDPVGSAGKSGEPGRTKGPDAEAWERGAKLVAERSRISLADAKTFIGLLVKEAKAGGLMARDLLPTVLSAEVNETLDPRAYLRKAVAAMVARRTVTHGQPAISPETWSEETWSEALRIYREDGRWGDSMGPKPGEPGCKVPARLLLGSAA